MFFRFSFPRNRIRYIFFQPCEVPAVSSFINFSCQGRFKTSFRQSPQVRTQTLLQGYNRRTYFVHILAGLGSRGELLTKQTKFLLQPYVRLARIASRNFTSSFSPALISLANFHKTHICAGHKATFKPYASKPTQDKLNRYKTVDMIERKAPTTRGYNLHIQDKDKVNFNISKEKLQCGLKNYSIKIT